MTNKTKNSKKWLKFALISTASLSTLATIPAAICAKPAVKTSTPALSDLNATGYIRVTFKIREDDTKTEVAPAATLSGAVVAKMKDGGKFVTVKKPTADRQGYDFLGWSKNPAYSSSENILTDSSVIEGNTTLYAVFSKVKMTVYFPESSEGDYQWTYDGATNNEEKKISVRFQKDDTLSKITCPTPKWKVPDETAPVVKVWDGKWYNKDQSQAGRTEITSSTVLNAYDRGAIYPGWKDVETKNIIISGDSTVSKNETNIKYIATAYPKETEQKFDWYVTDSFDNLSDNPTSTRAEINKDEGIVTTNLTDGSFYVFALAKGSKPSAATISAESPNVIKVEKIEPTEDPEYANDVITTFMNDGKQQTYAIPLEEFYKDDNEEIQGKLLGGEVKSIGIDRKDFNHPIAFGNKITKIDDGFMPSSYEQDEETEQMLPKAGYASFNSSITFNNVTYIGSEFLLNNLSFNQPLNLTWVVHIGDSFLDGCTAFTKTVNFGVEDSHITYIGDSFMEGCISYEQLGVDGASVDLTLPASLQHVGEAFLYNCKGMDTKAIIFKCSIHAFEPSDTSFAVDNNPEAPTNFVLNAGCTEDEYNNLISTFPPKDSTKDDLARGWDRY